MIYAMSTFIRKALLNVPVADLRRLPMPHIGRYEKDPLQESQLLFGEKLLVHEEQEGWLRVEAIQQLKFSERWAGYPGWILAHQAIQVDTFPQYNLMVIEPYAALYQDPSLVTLLLRLSFGSFLKGLKKQGSIWHIELPQGKLGFIEEAAVKDVTLSNNEDAIRREILLQGEKFLKFPYLWGGRSAYDPQVRSPLTSVDCSGLTHLLYGMHGIEIPRDARDQFLKSNPLKFNQLQLGDLIFLSSKADPRQIFHVMIWAGEERLLEAEMAAGCVRYVSFEEKLGIAFSEIANGKQCENYHLYYGNTLSIQK